MASEHNFKSHDWIDGYTTAMVYISDIFESHSQALVKNGYFSKSDLKLIVNIIDAAIRRRELLAEKGSRGVNLFVSKKRTASIKEK